MEEKKRKLLDEIATARLNHLKWKSYFEISLRDISKFKINMEEVQPISTECQFGKWYYGDGQGLSRFNVFHEIEKVHEKIHEIYFKIIKVINKDDKSIFTSKKSYLQTKQFLIDDLLMDMNNYSSILRGLLSQLEAVVHNMKEN